MRRVELGGGRVRWGRATLQGLVRKHGVQYTTRIGVDLHNKIYIYTDDSIQLSPHGILPKRYSTLWNLKAAGIF